MKSFKYKTGDGSIITITKKPLPGGVEVQKDGTPFAINERMGDEIFKDASTANRGIARYAKRHGWKEVTA